MRGRGELVGRDGEIGGQWDTGRDVERETGQGVGDTQRERHEGWKQRQVQRWKEPRHGKKDEARDRQTTVWRIRQRDANRHGRKTGRDRQMYSDGDRDMHMKSETWEEGHKER